MTRFCSDKFGKTMTMTAISKGFRRIMKILDFSNHENNVKSKTIWTNKFETDQTDQLNDERIGEFFQFF
jgi:hypothetical protein